MAIHLRDLVMIVKGHAATCSNLGARNVPIYQEIYLSPG